MASEDNKLYTLLSDERLPKVSAKSLVVSGDDDAYYLGADYKATNSTSTLI